MNEILQHGVVTAIALAAFVILIRRIAWPLRPRSSKAAACASCAMGPAARPKPGARSDVRSVEPLRPGHPPEGVKPLL